jgi:hypothetical protein
LVIALVLVPCLECRFKLLCRCPVDITGRGPRLWLARFRWWLWLRSLSRGAGSGFLWLRFWLRFFLRASGWRTIARG